MSITNETLLVIIFFLFGLQTIGLIYYIGSNKTEYMRSRVLGAILMNTLINRGFEQDKASAMFNAIITGDLEALEALEDEELKQWVKGMTNGRFVQ